jgi:hypothetical protein
MTNPSERYVRFEFIGYAPCSLAIELHLLGKKCDINQVSEDMQPYLEHNGIYRFFNKKAEPLTQSPKNKESKR